MWSMAADPTKFYKTFQFRGYVREGGHERLEAVLEQCRRLYNRYRWERREAHRQYKINISGVDQNRWFTRLRAQDEFWDSVSTHIGRGVILRLDKAFQGFFDRISKGETPGYPRYMPETRWVTIEIDVASTAVLKISPNGKKGYIRIKGLPTVQIKLNKQVPNPRFLKTIGLTKRPTGWWVSLSFSFVPEPDLEGDDIGIDLGVNNRLALSDGTLIDGRTPDRERENRLRRQLERRTKRDDKGRVSGRQSIRRGKSQKALARETFRNQARNRNECHRITTGIVRNYGRIAMEDLDTPDMTENIGGTPENPGTGVAAKTDLNRRILDQTWGTLRYQIRYKAEWAGTGLTLVNPAYTSRECNICGRRPPQQSYRVYVCGHCVLLLDRDINAARNVYNRAFSTRAGPPLASA